jgi:membrane-bound serine protease (ClpP class)
MNVVITDGGIEIIGALTLAVLSPLALLLWLVLRLTSRSRPRRVTTGADGMIGQTGIAETEMAPDGTVFVHGELWRARAAIRIAAGERVRVIGVEGLVLEVEPVDLDKAMLNRPSSLFDQR